MGEKFTRDSYAKTVGCTLLRSRKVISQHDNKTVCPKCGVVCKDGVVIARAEGMRRWLFQGFVLRLCQKCEKDNKTILAGKESSNEFNFDKGV